MHDDDYEDDDQDDGLDESGLTEAQRKNRWEKRRKQILRAKRLVFITTPQGKGLKLINTDDIDFNTDFQI